MKLKDILDNLIFDVTQTDIDSCEWVDWRHREKNPLAVALKRELVKHYPNVVVYAASAINIFLDAETREFIDIPITRHLLHWDTEWAWEQKNRPKPITVQLYPLPEEYDPETQTAYINWKAGIVGDTKGKSPVIPMTKCNP